MIAFHNRIRRDSIYANRIVCRKLTIILQIIQTGIKAQADASVRCQTISFSIKFHADAIGVHVIPLTGILGNHQTMTFIHAIALYQPTGIGSIKSRSYIIIDITGRYLIINYQRLVTEKRSYRHPHIFLFSRRFGGIGIK